MSLALAAAAATVADVNKTTLSLLWAIKAGKVSGKRSERRRVAGAELHRICPPAAQRAIPRRRTATHRLRSRPRSPACVRSRSSCAASSRRPARTATAGPKQRPQRCVHYRRRPSPVASGGTATSLDAIWRASARLSSVLRSETDAALATLRHLDAQCES
jgi:hypothetical protein